MLEKRAILFLDDAFCRAVMAQVLVKKGYQVTTFDNPDGFACRACPPQGGACAEVLIVNQLQFAASVAFIEHLCSMNCQISGARKAIMSGQITEAKREEARRLECQLFANPAPIDEIFAWLDQVENLLED